MATVGSLILNLEARTARMEADLRRAQGLIRKLQNEVQRFGGQTQTSERQITQAFSRMAAGLGPLQGGLRNTTQLFGQLLAVAASFGGVQLVRQAIRLGDAIAAMAQQVGVSVEALQRLRLVAELNGASADIMDRALNVLNERLGEASRGVVTAQQAFANLGLRWQDLQGLPVDQVFLAVADALQQFTNQSDRADRMSQVLGDRSRALLNVMNLTSTGIQQASERFARYGGVLSTEVVTRLATTNNTLTELGRLLESRIAVLIAGVTPDIIAWAESFERVIAAVTGSNEALADLTTLENLVVETLKNIGAGAKLVGDLFGFITEGVKQTIANFELKPLGDQIERLDTQIRTLEQNLTVLGRAPAEAANTAAIEQQTDRLRQLLAMRQRLNTEALRIMQQGGAAPPPRPTTPETLPAVTVRGQRPPIRAPFTVPAKAEDPAKKLADLDKSLAENRLQLEGWAAVLEALGRPINQTTEYINLLESAIRARLGLGIPPTAKAIQDLTAELAPLQQRAADLGLQESRRDLDAWAQVMQALGQPIDQTTQRIDALTQSIKDRLHAGVAPATKVIQDLTAELKALQDQAAQKLLVETGLEAMAETPEGPDLPAIFAARRASLQALSDTTKAFGDTAGVTAKRLDIFRESLEQARIQGVSPLDPALENTRQEIIKLDQVMAAIEGRAFPTDTIRDRLRDLDTSVTGTLQKSREELQMTQNQLLLIQETFPQYSAQVQRAQRAVNIELARTTLLGQGVELVAQGITDAFDQSFQGIIQGTLSISEAFRNMVQSIALSISKLLIQKGIMLLLDIALAGLAPGVGAGAGASGAGAIGGGAAFAQQGGPIPGRGRGDTVPILAEPGEFMLRRHAAMILGQPFLQQLNERPTETMARVTRQAQATGTPPMRRAQAALSPDLLATLARLPRFQQGGPVGAMMGGAEPSIVRSPRLPTPPGVMSTQRTREAPVNITHTAVVVKNEQEAQAKRQELEALENQIVTVVTKNILGGDGNVLNRSLRMVHGGR